MTRDTSFQIKLARLKQVYKQSLPDKVDHLTMIHARLSQQNDIADTIVLLEEATHKLSGSAGSYDYHHISAAAHELEYRCRSLQSDELVKSSSEDIWH